MGTLETILAEHPFLKGIASPHIQSIAGFASNAHFEKGDYLFRENEEADRFYLIRQGSVALDVFVPQRGAVTIETVREGEALGWSWLFPPFRWHFDARALEPTRAFAFDGKCLRQRCDDDPQFGYDLVKRFSQVFLQRLQSARLQLLDLYGDSAEK